MMKTLSYHILKLSCVSTLLLATGCSTVFNNRQQSVNIYTPQNQTATVKIHSPQKSPYKTTIPNTIYARPSSFEPLSIQVIDPCFKPMYIDTHKSVHPSYWANVFTYFLGFPIDYITGYMWSYDKNLAVPLAPIENTDTNCTKNIKNNPSPSPPPSFFKNEPKKHQISTGIIVQTPSNRYDTEDVDAGFFVEYNHQFHNELMSSIKWSYGSSNVEHAYDCNNTLWLCYDNIQTNTHTLAFSLRHYINKTTNFYAGLGIAQNFISQKIGYAESDQTSATSSSTFFSLGWQARRNSPSLHLNATIDFAELHLATPELYYYNRRSDRHDKALNKKADSLLQSATLTSHISLGFTLGF